jgi:hypothetical protein
MCTSHSTLELASTWIVPDDPGNHGKDKNRIKKSSSERRPDELGKELKIWLKSEVSVGVKIKFERGDTGFSLMKLLFRGETEWIYDKTYISKGILLLPL